LYITTIVFDEGWLTGLATLQIRCNSCGKTGAKTLQLRIIEQES
jgi:hypothetical protein